MCLMSIQHLLFIIVTIEFFLYTKSGRKYVCLDNGRFPNNNRNFFIIEHFLDCFHWCIVVILICNQYLRLIDGCYLHVLNKIEKKIKS